LPFDGVVVKCIVNELSDMLLGGRIEKIFQPESDEIILNVRAKGQNLKLLLSANPSYPRVHFTESSKDNPAAPPVFCMLLRKHLSGGKITGIEFHDFERIITIEAESMNELGDLSSKKLIIEIMGRHSNIILVSNEGRILDSIKHVDSDVNRIREIMPGRPYILPPPQDKHNPEQVDIDLLFSEMKAGAETSIEKQLLSSIKGFSPLLCREICFLSGIDDRRPWGSLSEVEINSLKKALSEVIGDIENNRFNPCIIYDGTVDEKPIDFHCLKIKQYVHSKSFDSMSNVLDLFYFEKDRIERSKQKKADVLKLLNNNIDRCNKKLALQYDKLREVSEREKIKLAGELITANIYAIQKGVKKVSLLNYYSENREYLEISLDENLTPQENAQRYFKQYVKAKNAYISTSKR
jgi:predicted ribosome quality control (RQC) complex YloA/Tae2 family protein